MNSLELMIKNSGGDVLSRSEEDTDCTLLHIKEYQHGDAVVLKIQTIPCYLVVQFEDSLAPQLIYATQNEISYTIPFDSDRIVFSPKCFVGERHVIRARLATEKEISARQNLALNVYDRHGEIGYYPHSSANVETRGEAVFASYNAIDGVFENENHGRWPYQSWGINQDPNAAIKIDFGRTVTIDEVKITLRADFPHDSYWTSGTVSFSDGSEEVLNFIKTKRPQQFDISPRTITWVKFDRLLKADDESPFPALTQIEIIGRNK